MTASDEAPSSERFCTLRNIIDTRTQQNEIATSTLEPRASLHNSLQSGPRKQWTTTRSGGGHETDASGQSIESTQSPHRGREARRKAAEIGSKAKGQRKEVGRVPRGGGAHESAYRRCRGKSHRTQDKGFQQCHPRRSNRAHRQNQGGADAAPPNEQTDQRSDD